MRLNGLTPFRVKTVKKQFEPLHLEVHRTKGWLCAQPAKTGLAGFPNRLGQFSSLHRVGKPEADKTARPVFLPSLRLVRIKLSFSSCFNVEKLQNTFWDTFPTAIRPPHIYIYRRLRNLAFNPPKLQFLPFLPYFSNLLLLVASLVRSNDVVSGLADSKTISACTSPTGLPGKVFSSSIGEGRASNRSNRSLDRFH